MRKVKIQDKELLKLLKEKKLVVKKGQKLTAEQERVQKQLKQLELKVNQFNERVKPLVDKHKIETDKYEFLNQIEIENGKIVITVKNYLEEFKNQMDEKLAKQKEAKEKNLDKQKIKK